VALGVFFVVLRDILFVHSQRDSFGGSSKKNIRRDANNSISNPGHFSGSGFIEIIPPKKENVQSEDTNLR